VVDEFPDIFRRRVPAPGATKVKKAASKDRPAEPYLFPLH
jgi:hypothetical protein